ncbi:SAF domain-containing protein [Candidatus Nanopelagicus hibericus]|nr:SAF domain-containing protein [Candidatus Nanopelagicus hibericus]
MAKLDFLKNSRLAMGLALLIIALSAASLISKEANRTVLVWASVGELAPGQIITPTDIIPASVLLAQSAKNYFSSAAQIVGATVISRISTGDLIPVAAISNEVDSTDKRLVPLSVEITDLPIALVRGDVIDIYAIPKRDSKSIITPELLAAGVSVEQVLERSNSGSVSVLVILNSDQVISALNLITDSRLIIVRSF